jgi:type IV pilus assembly protein PilQ
VLPLLIAGIIILSGLMWTGQEAYLRNAWCQTLNARINNSHYSILENISIKNTKNQTTISLLFDKIPENIIKPSKNGCILLLKDTKTNILSWPNALSEGIISQIELSAIENDLAISLKTEKEISYKKTIKENKIILTFIKDSSDQKEMRFPIEIPSNEGKIKFPLIKNSYQGKQITIDIQNAELQNILRLLAKIGGFNLVLSDDVQGKITLSLQNVPWDQVLDIILVSKGLGMVKKGN